MKPLFLLVLLAAAGCHPAAAQIPNPTVINVEIDYMVDTFHGHRPLQAEIDAVVQMFACQGVTLNVVIDDELMHWDVLLRDPNDPGNFFGYSNGLSTFGGIKDQFFDHGSGWHYAVFGHQYQDTTYTASGSSGTAELEGDDFIVTLGAFSGQTGTQWDRAGTFAHELGHNLGLRHAGNMNPNTVGKYAPDVPSVMTYFAQLQGVRTALQCNGVIAEEDGETLFKELDYSHGRACTLNESALSEPRGMGIVSVDWNCNGTISGTVAQDVGEQRNGWCGSTAGLDVLTDYNEWDNLVDVTSLRPSEYTSEEIACVTIEEMEAYRAYLEAGAGGCQQPTPVEEACTSRQMHYLITGNHVSTGSCTLPFNSLTEIVAGLDAGDILYVGPGSYPTTGIVLSEEVQILGPGGAVLGDN